MNTLRDKKNYWLIIIFALFIPCLLTLSLFILHFLDIQLFPMWANWLMFATYIPLVIVTLVINQRNQLSGPYGETILILIPTFVWLLAGQNSSIKWLIFMSMAIAGVGLISFFVGSIFKKGTFTRQLLMKLAFVGSAVISTVVISVVLLNWGDDGVKLAGEDHNYSSKNWIIFIAVVTVASALLLVSIGLVNTFEKVKIDKTQLIFMGSKRRRKLQAERKKAVAKRKLEAEKNKKRKTTKKKAPPKKTKGRGK